MQPTYGSGPLEPFPDPDSVRLQEEDAEPRGPQDPRMEAPPSGLQTHGSVEDMVPLLSAEVAEVVEESLPPADTADAAEPAPPAEQAEDTVPLVEAEAVYPFEPPMPPQATVSSWQDAPPIRTAPTPPAPETPPPTRSRKKKSKPPVTPPVEPPPQLPPEAPEAPEPLPRHARETMRANLNEPLELPYDPANPPPPPARGAPATAVMESLAPPPDHHVDHETELDHVPATRRRARWYIAAGAAVIVSVVGLMAYYVIGTLRQTEEQLAQQANSEIEAKKFDSAQRIVKTLIERFPDSDDKNKYEFLVEMTAVLGPAFRFNENPENVFDRLPAYYKNEKNNKFLDPYQGLFSEAFEKLVKDLTRLAEAERNKDALEKARAALDHYQGTKRNGAAPTKEEVLVLVAAINKVQDGIDKEEKRKGLVAEAQRLIQKPTIRGIERFRTKLVDEGLDKDIEFANLINDMEKGWQQQIKFVPAPEIPPAPLVEHQASLLVTPSLRNNDPAPARNFQVVFALADGVLTAHDQGSGEVLWAARVGKDMSRLPVRLPAGDLPELALVLSSDTNLLAARRVSVKKGESGYPGEVLWRHYLGKAPCVGRPVVLGPRVFVPTYDGKVHVLELSQGKLLGWYDLGQRLSLGGTHQEGTSLIYFPADQQRVYVLNVADAAREQACVAVLQSGHPAGTLRGEPIVIRRSLNLNKGEPDLLILCQDDGLKAMKMRVFALPLTRPDGPPVPGDEPRTAGWSLFPPYFDSEKLVQIAEDGIIDVLKIKQSHNLDPELFLEREENIHAGAHPGWRGQSQVVHAAEPNTLWVLARGFLDKLHFEPFSPRLLRAWAQPLPLGSPLHQSQVDDAGNTLFLVTQAPDSGACLATAVDADRGSLRWQRQLGVHGKGEPLQLGEETLMLDRGGAWFLFDPAEKFRPLNGRWQAGGLMLAPPWDGTAVNSQQALGFEGQAAYALGCIDRGAAAKGSRYQLAIRSYQAGKKAPAPELRVDWPSPLGGTCAADNVQIVAPLTDGTLQRQPLDGSPGNSGRKWRAETADPDSVGHVVQVGTGEYLFTDGSHTISRLQWPVGQVWQPPKPEVKLPARIVAPPLLLPQAQGVPFVLVADVDNNLTLLRADLQGKPERMWKLPGTLTAGPFRRGSHVGCVLDRRTLVWLDPARDGFLWKQPYTTPGKAIVGEPHVLGGMVVVADLSGRFVGLDPATGQPHWQNGFRLEASVAPAASPTPFGPNQALAPLSDGTLLRLSLQALRHPLEGLPLIP